MKDDFRKFAIGHRGINSMVFDDVIKAQSQYLPVSNSLSILAETP